MIKLKISHEYETVNGNIVAKTTFLLEAIRALKLRKRFLMDSIKISYLESSVTAILSLYYLAKHKPLNAFSMAVLNLTIVPMICNTIVAINHNKCIDMLEDVIKTFASLRKDKKFENKNYGAITGVDEDALKRNAPLPLEGKITHLHVNLFSIPITDGFFLNVLLNVATAIVRAVYFSSPDF